MFLETPKSIINLPLIDKDGDTDDAISPSSTTPPQDILLELVTLPPAYSLYREERSDGLGRG